MRIATRGIVGATVGLLATAGPVWGHPGHVTEGGLWSTLSHAFSSPYHVAVVAALVVLGVAVTLAARPGRPADRKVDEPSS